MKILQMSELTLDNLLPLLQGMGTECVAEIQIDEGSPDSFTLTVPRLAVESAKKALQAYPRSKFSVVLTAGTSPDGRSAGVNAPDITPEDWASMSLNDRGSAILKEIRRQCSWTLENAAGQIGVTLSGWTYAEQGKRRIGRGMASKIRENLTLSPKLDSMLREATTDR